MEKLTAEQISYGECLMIVAMRRASRAMERYPQPNYVLTKVAEEAGEVVKVGVHLAEGRDFNLTDLEDECIDTIAMCFRLLIEGDQKHGVPSFWETRSGAAPSRATHGDAAGATRPADGGTLG